MKKFFFTFGFVSIIVSVFAQVDTFSLNNMPRNYYLGEWPDYSDFVSIRDNGDGSQSALHLSYDAEIYYNPLQLLQPMCVLDYGLSFFGASIDSSIWNSTHINNFAVGKYSDVPIEIAGIALVYPRILLGGLQNVTGSVRERFLSSGRDILALQLLDSAMQVLAEGVSFLVDSVGNPVFVFNEDRVEVSAETENSAVFWYDVYEVYFSTPVTVVDSFYVASRFTCSTSDYPFGMAVPGIYENFASFNVAPYYRFPKMTWLTQGGYKYVVDSVNNGLNKVPVADDEWFAPEGCEESHGVMLIFPILAVDCEAPDSVVWAPMGGGNVRVSWEQGQWVSGWEVSYGPTGTLPGEGTVLQTAAPSVMLGGITMDTDYVVYVRSLCTVRDTVWSEWSDGTPFTLRSQGIEDANEAADVALQPNPASGAVLLTAEATLTGVEVYTAAGAPFLRLPATGSALRIDTSTWPSGTYLLDVSTARGTTTKRLVVTH